MSLPNGCFHARKKATACTTRDKLLWYLLFFQECFGQAQDHSTSAFFHTFPLSKKFGAQTSFKLKQRTAVLLIGEQVFGFYK
jgi:hypothetical protein